MNNEQNYPIQAQVHTLIKQQTKLPKLHANRYDIRVRYLEFEDVVSYTYFILS